jgi:hypothetical protein
MGGIVSYNSTPYDAKPMNRGLGCLLGITKQRTFTSNLLPIYLGALGGIVNYFYACAKNPVYEKQLC